MRQQAESSWVTQAQFTEFTHWKHGVDPLRKDSAQRRLDYLTICQQVGPLVLSCEKVVKSSHPLCSYMTSFDTYVFTVEATLLSTALAYAQAL